MLAASSIEDCYYITQEAFNLAEEFQTPVIVLSDLQFGMCKQSVPAFDMNRVGIHRGKLLTEGLPELDTRRKPTSTALKTAKTAFPREPSPA